MIGVGFEPTPPKRLVPKTSALDRSAIQPKTQAERLWYTEDKSKKRKKLQKANCVHRDSNPNLILGRDKYYPCTMDARPPSTHWYPSPTSHAGPWLATTLAFRLYSSVGRACA